MPEPTSVLLILLIAVPVALAAWAVYWGLSRNLGLPEPEDSNLQTVVIRRRSIGVVKVPRRQQYEDAT